MNYNSNYNTKKGNHKDILDKYEKHEANVELAKRIKYEIEHFFDEENKKNYSNYFTESEARELRDRNTGKKNSAIITKLSEELNMSSKTFYHMLNGKNSQFNKIVEVLEFFGLSFRYDIFFNEEMTIYNKQKMVYNENDPKVSSLEDEVVKLVLSLDEASLKAIKPILEHQAKLNTKNNIPKVKNYYDR
ncbi:MAG: hypothetical protein ACK5LV_01290 [Lachnospirales bacterium]